MWVCVTREKQPLSSGAKGGHALPGLRCAGQSQGRAEIRQNSRTASLQAGYAHLTQVNLLAIPSPAIAVAKVHGQGRQGLFFVAQVFQVLGELFAGKLIPERVTGLATLESTPFMAR